MITQIRKVGNSAGVVIPSALLKEASLFVGSKINITMIGGSITIERIQERRKGSKELSISWLLEDFQNIKHELIPGSFGAEEITDDYHYPPRP